MSLFKQLWFPSLIIVIPGVIFSLFLPCFSHD
jgi:hypothetical protein